MPERKGRGHLCLLALSAAFWTQHAAAQPVELAGVTLPASVEMAGETLELTACGVRSSLFINHFVASLYLPQRDDAPPQVALDPEAPKLIRLDILNTGWLPAELPERWRNPLERKLSPDSFWRISETYRAISAGDMVLVYYVPEAGVAIEVNDQLVVFEETDHDLVEALLQSWSDPYPVAERIDELMWEHRC